MEDKEIQLINLAQKGDMRAFEQLIYKYDRIVLNIAYSYRADQEDAKDIYQEVFMRVFRSLKNFQFKSEFSTWLYRIAANVCINYKNDRYRNLKDSIDKNIYEDSQDSVSFADTIQGYERSDRSLLNSELKDYLNQALDQLPAQQKMAFTLKFYDELKIKDISEIMNCAEGTIKRYIFNATNKVKEYLSKAYSN